LRHSVGESAVMWCKWRSPNRPQTGCKFRQNCLPTVFILLGKL